MKSCFLVAIAVLACCFSGAVAADPNPWIPVDWQTLPKALPTDQVQVSYLLAPLLEDDLKDLLALFDLFHGAVAFTNLRTNFSITINYDADDFFRASMFPEVVTYPNGSLDLKWDNGGAVYIYLDIYTPYWTAGIIPVTTISGDVYNQFISQWNSNLNKTHPYYNMFGIVDKSNHDFIPSYDCFDYVWEALTQLYDMGVKFPNGTSLKRNFADLIASSAPVRVTELYTADPNVRADIIHFYEVLSASLKKLTWPEIVYTLLEVLEGEFYLRVNEDYYKMTLSWPLFRMSYVEDTIPSTKRSSVRGA